MLQNGLLPFAELVQGGRGAMRIDTELHLPPVSAEPGSAVKKL
mgnify:CR=1 FL=1